MVRPSKPFGERQTNRGIFHKAFLTTKIKCSQLDGNGQMLLQIHVYNIRVHVDPFPTAVVRICNKYELTYWLVVMDSRCSVCGLLLSLLTDPFSV